MSTGIETQTGTDQTVTLAEVSEEAARTRRRFGRRRKRAQQGPAGEGSTAASPDQGGLLGRLRKRNTAVDAEGNEISGKIKAYPQLMAVKPRESMLFHSDYYVVDGKHVTIMGLFHDASGHEVLPPFWGVNRIPQSLGPNVSVTFFEQVARRSDKWVQQHLNQSERMDRLAKSDTDGSLASSRRRADKVASDMFEVGTEVQNGASYVHVHNRMMVTAPSLSELDEAVKQIRDSYTERFGTLNVAAYPGEQRRELTALFDKNEKKRGRGFGYTSVEFAGAYSLFTNGLTDPSGEYLGFRTGDVNVGAVLVDLNRYSSHVVVCDPQIDGLYPGRMYVSSLWDSKLSQAALTNGGRVVHLVLDNTDLDELGPKFDRLTARINMNSGDVNMFEFFGREEDELALFSRQTEKIALMAEQSYGSSDADRAIIRGNLNRILTDFYTGQRMWHANPVANRERLRLVGLPHEQVPRLESFVGYLDNALTEARQKQGDPTLVRSLTILQTTFNSMLDVNSDLFNTQTSSMLDRTAAASRIVYDFGSLLERGQGVAMAQLVNVVGFAVSDLRVGDTLILHGADRITDDPALKAFLKERIEDLNRRGGRVVYSYNDMSRMLDDSGFNRLTSADYSVLGALNADAMGRYEDLIGTKIPSSLKSLIGDSSSGVSYIRRGVENAVFRREFELSSPTEKARDAEKAKDRLSTEEAVRKLSALRRRGSGKNEKNGRGQ